MEGRALRARVPVLVLTIWVGLSGVAGADSRTADAATTDRGIDIIFERERSGGSATGRSGGGSPCTWSATPYPDNLYNAMPDVYGSAPSPDHQLWMVFCDGRYVTTRWLGPNDFAEVAIQPIVDRLVRQVLVDGVEVRSRPNGKGITGIPSLFWVEGYDGPITATEEAFGLSVTVTAKVRTVEWDFGDGTQIVRAGLGEPWPERSSVRHNYRHRTHPGRPYVVTATLVLDAGFSVDGQPPHALPAITRLGRLELHVGEIQAVRNR